MVQLTIQMITFFSHVTTLLPWSLFLKTDWFQGETIRSLLDPFGGTGKGKRWRENADRVCGTEWSNFELNFLVPCLSQVIYRMNKYLFMKKNKYLFVRRRKDRELDLTYYHRRIPKYVYRLKVFALNNCRYWLWKSETVSVKFPSLMFLLKLKNFCSFSSSWFLKYLLALFSNITGYLLWVFYIQTVQCQTIYQIHLRFLLKGIIGISLFKRILKNPKNPKYLFIHQDIYW